MDKLLFLITARGGSKGIPGKNIKQLGGKPLIQYSIELARKFVPDSQICVSTDSDSIIEVVQSLGLQVPFKRPDDLASDEAGSFGVIKHALSHYLDLGKKVNKVILLQPTSPFRIAEDIKNSIRACKADTDMSMTVKETSSNPYYILYEEDKNGWLQKSKTHDAVRRQDAPVVYEVNGAVYAMQSESILKANSFADFKNLKKVLMPEERSFDLDNMLDWEFAEFLIEKGYVEINL
ncbi:MAG: CMP-N-acetylneuraminic acid synthetase [Crocinitomicaceae bacterium]|nr:CMP-N-acetylneuraminic acid synthetase [Crocinitomicaceae bacterium]|tara:strand:+ start:1264 stop:1968 length:705 start_codon:yes stop_codon:yes gene_type:complete